MGRKDWKKDFIMCKLDGDVACCGCGECLNDKREEYVYKKMDDVLKEINRAKSSERSAV